MNRPLRRMAAVLMILFGLLFANVNYIQAIQADELRTREGNSRTVLEEYSRARGDILVDGRVVATSVETEGNLRYRREYANGPLYAHATGYYSFIYGATEVERAENPVLAGTDPRLFVRRLGDLITGDEAEGGDVVLTLDREAQAAAREALGDQRGAVVALEPATGAILAMVSSPSYDPNDLTQGSGEEVRAAFNELTGAESNPMLNRAINETYPPGSTFKVVTLAAALSSGRYTADSEVPGPAELDLPQTTTTLPNYDLAPCSPGSDTTTFTTALERSCNSTFGAVALELGADALREQAEAFGFNADLTVPQRAAQSVFPDDVDDPGLAQSAIGQRSVRATPLQMAMVAAGIANNGVVMDPYLVESVLAPDLAVLGRTEPEALSTAMEPRVADTITEMMVRVVDEGTGSNAAIPGVEVAGKTGTAQTGTDRPPHAWFISFAPADDPQVAVAVVIENGGGQAEVSGNRLAAPVAREVMQAVLAGEG